LFKSKNFENGEKINVITPSIPEVLKVLGNIEFVTNSVSLRKWFLNLSGYLK